MNSKTVSVTVKTLHKFFLNWWSVFSSKMLLVFLFRLLTKLA